MLFYTQASLLGTFYLFLNILLCRLSVCRESGNAQLGSHLQARAGRPGPAHNTTLLGTWDNRVCPGSLASLADAHHSFLPEASLYIASYLRSLVATLLSYEVEECELRLWFCISIKLFPQGLGHMRGFGAIGLDVRRALHVGIEGSWVVSVLLILISRVRIFWSF